MQATIILRHRDFCYRTNGFKKWTLEGGKKVKVPREWGLTESCVK